MAPSKAVRASITMFEQDKHWHQGQTATGVGGGSAEGDPLNKPELTGIERLKRGVQQLVNCRRLGHGVRLKNLESALSRYDRPLSEEEQSMVSHLLAYSPLMKLVHELFTEFQAAIWQSQPFQCNRRRTTAFKNHAEKELATSAGFNGFAMSTVTGPPAEAEDPPGFVKDRGELASLVTQLFSRLKFNTIRSCYWEIVEPIKKEGAIKQKRYEMMRDQLAKLRREYLTEIAALRDEQRMRVDPEMMLHKEGPDSPSDVKFFFEPTHGLTTDETEFVYTVVHEKLKMLFETSTSGVQSVNFDQLDRLKDLVESSQIPLLKESLAQSGRESEKLSRQVASLERELKRSGGGGRGDHDDKVVQGMMSHLEKQASELRADKLDLQRQLRQLQGDPDALRRIEKEKDDLAAALRRAEEEVGACGQELAQMKGSLDHAEEEWVRQRMLSENLEDSVKSANAKNAGLNKSVDRLQQAKRLEQRSVDRLQQANRLEQRDAEGRVVVAPPNATTEKGQLVSAHDLGSAARGASLTNTTGEASGLPALPGEANSVRQGRHVSGQHQDSEGLSLDGSKLASASWRTDTTARLEKASINNPLLADAARALRDAEAEAQALRRDHEALLARDRAQKLEARQLREQLRKQAAGILDLDAENALSQAADLRSLVRKITRVPGAAGQVSDGEDDADSNGADLDRPNKGVGDIMDKLDEATERLESSLQGYGKGGEEGAHNVALQAADVDRLGREGLQAAAISMSEMLEGSERAFQRGALGTEALCPKCRELWDVAGRQHMHISKLSKVLVHVTDKLQDLTLKYSNMQDAMQAQMEGVKAVNGVLTKQQNALGKDAVKQSQASKDVTWAIGKLNTVSSMPRVFERLWGMTKPDQKPKIVVSEATRRRMEKRQQVAMMVSLSEAIINPSAEAPIQASGSLEAAPTRTTSDINPSAGAPIQAPGRIGSARTRTADRPRSSENEALALASGKLDGARCRNVDQLKFVSGSAPMRIGPLPEPDAEPSQNEPLTASGERSMPAGWVVLDRAAAPIPDSTPRLPSVAGARGRSPDPHPPTQHRQTLQQQGRVSRLVPQHRQQGGARSVSPGDLTRGLDDSEVIARRYLGDLAVRSEALPAVDGAGLTPQVPRSPGRPLPGIRKPPASRTGR